MYFAALIIENIPDKISAFMNRYEHVLDFCEHNDLFVFIFVKEPFSNAQTESLMRGNPTIYMVESCDYLMKNKISSHNFDLFINFIGKNSSYEPFLKIVERKAGGPNIFQLISNAGTASASFS